MAHLTKQEIDNAAKAFKQSNGGDEFKQYFPEKENWFIKMINWIWEFIKELLKDG